MTANTTRGHRWRMAGYVPGLIVGMGTGALTRAWPVARRDNTLTTSAVVAGVTVARLIDSIAFAAFVALALVITPLAASADTLKTGLALGGIASFLITVLLLFWLFGSTPHAHRLPRWLAVGVLLPAPDYVFIMVFPGLWVLIGFVIQIPGSSIPATVFVLGLFGVPGAQALAMTLMVGGAFLLSYGGVGALALRLEGLRVNDLKPTDRP